MSKKSKGENRKPEKTRKKKRSADRNTSTLDQHRRKGKSLVPPLMASLPFMSFSSWLEERLPEMLWAALIVAHLEREDALAVFRHVAVVGERLKDTEGGVDITLSGIARMPRDVALEAIARMASNPDVREALRSLLVLDCFPGRDLWEEQLVDAAEDTDAAWHRLILAVGLTFGHQSQEATDCRWVRVLFQMRAHKMVFASGLAEHARELAYYPDYGDQKKVRPSVRAAEGSLGSLVSGKTEWAREFWIQCLRDTKCVGTDGPRSALIPSIGTSRDRIREVRKAVVQHFYDCLDSTEVDARFDTTFGISLFVLTLLEELMAIGVSSSIGGRFYLRTLLEALITLKYLSKKADPALWQSHRVYGAGQAKLSLLKVEDDDNPPEYINSEALEQLANEDAWQEFLEIDLGHWSSSNLRKMAEESGEKDLYDRYYPWPSAFSHSHWGAVRNSSFQTCLNPLHRGHRIPVEQPIPLEDVLADACMLVDRILEVLDAEFPSFTARVTISRVPSSD